MSSLVTSLVDGMKMDGYMFLEETEAKDAVYDALADLEDVEEMDPEDTDFDKVPDDNTSLESGDAPSGSRDQ